MKKTLLWLSASAFIMIALPGLTAASVALLFAGMIAAAAWTEREQGRKNEDPYYRRQRQRKDVSG